MVDEDILAQFAREFERVRLQRLQSVNEEGQLDPPVDVAEALADMANMAMQIFVGNKVNQIPQGFKSNTKRD